MLSVEEALRRVMAEVPRLPVESVALSEALGRTLADSVNAVLDVPRWDNSAMDGYALRAEDTTDGDVALRLNEVVGAGSVPKDPVSPGTASAVMTGAPIPTGANAVVMVEKTDGAQRGAVRVTGRAKAGQHIRRRGEDVRKGLPLFDEGIRLTSGHLGVLASQGLTSLFVSRRPVVSVLTTGNEVVEPGRPLGPGQIYSSNNALLLGMIAECGGVGVDAGNALDDAHSIVTRLQWCVAEADVVVTTGGVSVGAFDHVKRAFDLIGARIDFWKVAMKPGKPVAFGVVEVTGRRVPLFGLPGNPVSCGVSFTQLVRPLLLKAMGRENAHLPVVQALCAAPIRVRPGRAKFVSVRIEQTDSGLVCRSAGSQGSGVLSSLAAAHGLLLIRADSDGVAEGARVRVQITDPSFLDRSDPGYGW